jgi:hypothetical protein
VNPEAMTLLQLQRMAHHVFRHGFAASAIVFIAVEQVSGKIDLLAQRTTEKITSTHAELFAGQIHTGHFNGGMQLQTVVVQAGSGVHDFPAQLLELQRIMPLQIRQQGLTAASALSPPPPSSPQPDKPLSSTTSTTVRTKRCQCTPAECLSGASSGTATVGLDIYNGHVSVL